MPASSNSAFNWRGQPSSFSSDPAFTAAKASGKTRSESASRAAQEYEQATGKSRNSLYGLSAASDESTARHRANKRRASGRYLAGGEIELGEESSA